MTTLSSSINKLMAFGENPIKKKDRRRMGASNSASPNSDSPSSASPSSASPSNYQPINSESPYMNKKPVSDYEDSPYIHSPDADFPYQPL